MTQESLDRLDNAKHWDFVAYCKVPVCFETGLETIDGSYYRLLREPHHTDDDIKRAKSWLRQTQDVVSLTVEKLT